MKKRMIYGIIIAVLILIGILLMMIFNKSKEKDELSDIEMIEDVTQEILTDGETDVIGYLKIKSINLEAPIKDGTELNTLKTAIGHFKNTAYFSGNICLAGHNRGYNQNFFENLDKVKEGDIIQYETKYTNQEYYVVEIKEVEETDLSILNPTEQDQITMITCIKNQRDKRLCVIARKQ